MFVAEQRQLQRCLPQHCLRQRLDGLFMEPLHWQQFRRLPPSLPPCKGSLGRIWGEAQAPAGCHQPSLPGVCAGLPGGLTASAQHTEHRAPGPSLSFQATEVLAWEPVAKALLSSTWLSPVPDGVPVLACRLSLQFLPSNISHVAASRRPVPTVSHSHAVPFRCRGSFP